LVADSISATPQQNREVVAAKELEAPAPAVAPPPQAFTFDDAIARKDTTGQAQTQSTLNFKTAQTRAVSPQSQIYQVADRAKAEAGADEQQNNLSKVIPAEAEFGQLIGDQTDGMLARFLQNKLNLMFWHRLNAQPDLIFGAELDLNRVVDGLRGLIQPDSAQQNEICVALLDDNAKPVVVSREKFQANWKHPFVATEIGDALPHWEVATYLVNPARLSQAARTARLTLGLFIAVLVLAIGVGSWLIVRNLNAELKLARQKTDFVSNVSHELKTPLTSIRMFSELLAEGRVADNAKQRSYLNIITAEAGRLTRLINNVLDFSRMERGEKKYNFQPCDLAAVVRGIEQTYRPHLEAGGFKFICELPGASVPVRGDADALSQVVVNLLSNAEKYSNGGREITLQLAQKQSPLPHAEIKVLDRGAGIPRGSEEKIFENFYRAHDSLSSGIQGSGLGLTIARQIARAHGGDVVYEPRDGGGSCFVLRLPISGGSS
jgi:signal transduction histidine kinase